MFVHVNVQGDGVGGAQDGGGGAQVFVILTQDDGWAELRCLLS